MSDKRCAKCHAESPRFPYDAPLWCAKCYARPVDPEATGGSRFTVESRTGWQGGRVRGAPRPDKDVRDGGTDDRETFGDA